MSYFTRKKYPIDFLTDQNDVDSYFFHSFLNVFIVQNRDIRFSKSLFRETYSIKEFNFEPSVEYQSFKLIAELQLTMKEVFYFRKFGVNKKVV